MKLTTIVIILGLISAVILGSMYLTPAWQFEDGAPTCQLQVIVKDSSINAEYPIDIALQPGTQLNQALETYTADIPPLNPTGQYTTAFIAKIKVNSPVEAETSVTTVTISGWNNRTMNIGGVSGPVNYTLFDSTARQNIKTLTCINGVQKTFDFTGQYFGSVSPRNVPTTVGPILGTMVDQAVFNINIVGIGSGGSYGATSATILLVVGAGGGLEIIIDSITTTVG